MGAQVTLWPRIGFRWIDRLREAVPDLGIRAGMRTSEDLTRAMTEGPMQVMLTHTPRVRPGLSVQRLIEDELVLVSPRPQDGPDDIAAFLPAAHVKRHVDGGRLYLVEGVPSFPNPVWSVWRDDLDEGPRPDRRHRPARRRRADRDRHLRTPRRAPRRGAPMPFPSDQISRGSGARSPGGIPLRAASHEESSSHP